MRVGVVLEQVVKEIKSKSRVGKNWVWDHEVSTKKERPEKKGGFIFLASGKMKRNPSSMESGGRAGRGRRYSNLITFGGVKTQSARHIRKQRQRDGR